MKVEKISTYESFVAVKKEWNTLLSNSGKNYPFLTHQWFDAWWQSFGHNNELEILFFRDESDFLMGIAPMMIEDGVLQFVASHEVTDYCDFILRADWHEEFYDNLLDHIRKNRSKYSRIEFINISDPSLTLIDMPRLAGRHNFNCEVIANEIAPLLILPNSYETYIHGLGRKNRHELRRKVRKLEALGDVRIEQLTESEELNPAIREFALLHRESSLQKQEFWEERGMSEFFSRLADLFSSENWVKLDMLYVEDRLIASLMKFSYEETVYFYNIAYDRKYAAYSPGFFLFDHAIKKAIEKNKKVADFLRGPEKYKYFFGAIDSKIYSLKLT